MSVHTKTVQISLESCKGTLLLDFASFKRNNLKNERKSYSKQSHSLIRHVFRVQVESSVPVSDTPYREGVVCIKINIIIVYFYLSSLLLVVIIKVFTTINCYSSINLFVARTMGRLDTPIASSGPHLSHGVQRSRCLMSFFQFSTSKCLYFVVAICDLVHAVKTLFHLRLLLTAYGI